MLGFAGTNVHDDIYFTKTGERIKCEFIAVSPKYIMVNNAGKPKVIRAKEIQGYRQAGQVIMSKRIVNDDDSSYIFLPFRKPKIFYNFLLIDSSPISRVTGFSDGKVTYYRLEEDPANNSSLLKDKNLRHYRLFIEDDIKGLSEIRFEKGLGMSKEKNQAAFELISGYLAGNSMLVEKIKANSDKYASLKVIDAYMEEFFGVGP